MLSLTQHTDGKFSASAIADCNLIPPSLRSVLSTAELSKRPSRAPDYSAQCRVLMALGEQLRASPDTILQKLTDAALTLCGAHSAGISLLSPTGSGSTGPPFRGNRPDMSAAARRATLGRAVRCWTATPRYYFRTPNLISITSPSHSPGGEAMLMPFYVNDKAVGTVWVVIHDLKPPF